METNENDGLDPQAVESLPEALKTLRTEKAVRNARRDHARPGGLIPFVRYFWKVLEPDTKLI